MKKAGTCTQILLIFALAFGTACHEPIANTSGAPESGRSDVVEAEETGDGDPVEASVTPTPDDEVNMNEDTKTNDEPAAGFHGNMRQNLQRHGLSTSDVYDASNPVEQRILNEYGAVFLTAAVPPSEVMFTSEEKVSAFQSKAGTASANIAGTNIELQPKAMEALRKAVEEARGRGLKITPRDGEEAGRRSYAKTLALWNSRFEPALKHWKSRGRLNDEQISRLRSLPIREQVAEVLKLEKQGIWFNTFFNNSILYSVAAPGTSQHLSMLAFDAEEFGNAKVREIMARHGWFRTVQNDEPHFTYLGHPESKLKQLGLKKVTRKSGEFWIPDVR